MKIIDLSHLLDNNTPVYPGSEKPSFVHSSQIDTDGFAETKISMLSHVGTHMDAPAHLISGAKYLDEFEIEAFYGKAICINCSHIKGRTIEMEDLQFFDARIKCSEFVLIYSGWSEKWGSNAYFEYFPVLSENACLWLSNFKLKGIGLDCISIDPIGTTSLPNHRIILSQNILIIENLKITSELTGQEFYFGCFPLKFRNSDGAAVRAVAFL
ncbi:MAG: cyclase family protein [Bacteroidales bacterium]